MGTHIVRAAILLVAIAFVTGCGPVAAPFSSSTSTLPASPSAPADSPTPSPSAPPASAPLTIPPCDQLMSLDAARALYGDATEVIDAVGDPAERVHHPAAVLAATAAEQTRVCAWGVPNSDGGFWVVVGELAPPTRADVVSQLQAAGTFAESTEGGAQAFAHDFDTEVGTMGEGHLFLGDAWISVWGALAGDGALAVGSTVLEGLRSANPGLVG